MNYIDLNLIHKEKMFSICQNTAHFEWEDTRFINLLKGELPEIRNPSNNSDVSGLYHKLYKKYTEYNFLNTNTDEFINEMTRQHEQEEKESAESVTEYKKNKPADANALLPIVSENELPFKERDI